MDYGSPLRESLMAMGMGTETGSSRRTDLSWEAVTVDPCVFFSHWAIEQQKGTIIRERR
jgi:hypothetical protein